MVKSRQMKKFHVLLSAKRKYFPLSLLFVFNCGHGYEEGDGHLYTKTIVNGKDYKGHPSVGRIQGFGYERHDFSCTATLVGRKTVLTAAHCGISGETGVFRTDDDEEYHGTFVRHPKYVDDSSPFDVAVINLETEIPYTTPSVLNHTDLYDGQDVTWVGFGYKLDENGKKVKPEVKRTATNYNIDAKTKTYTYDQSGTKGGTCDRDSGGPGFVENVFGMEAIAGIISRGDIPCKKLGVDARVDKNLDWIMKNSNFNAWPAPPFGNKFGTKIKTHDGNCLYVNESGVGRYVKVGPCKESNDYKWDLLRLNKSGRYLSHFVFRNKRSNKCLASQSDGRFKTDSCITQDASVPVSVYKKSNGKHMLISRYFNACLYGFKFVSNELKSYACELDHKHAEFTFQP